MMMMMKLHLPSWHRDQNTQRVWVPVGYICYKFYFLIVCRVNVGVILVAGVHSLCHRSSPRSMPHCWRRRRLQGSRQTEEEGQDVRWGDHGQTESVYINNSAFKCIKGEKIHLFQSVEWLICFICLIGTIVSIGDPKKKYTRYEKIGQGWVNTPLLLLFSTRDRFYVQLSQQLVHLKIIEKMPQN